MAGMRARSCLRLFAFLPVVALPVACALEEGGDAFGQRSTTGEGGDGRSWRWVAEETGATDAFVGVWSAGDGTLHAVTAGQTETPAVYRRRDGKWTEVARLPDTMRKVVGVKGSRSLGYFAVDASGRIAKQNESGQWTELGDGVRAPGGARDTVRAFAVSSVGIVVSGRRGVHYSADGTAWQTPYPLAAARYTADDQVGAVALTGTTVAALIGGWKEAAAMGPARDLPSTQLLTKAASGLRLRGTDAGATAGDGETPSDGSDVLRGFERKDLGRTLVHTVMEPRGTGVLVAGCSGKDLVVDDGAEPEVIALEACSRPSAFVVSTDDAWIAVRTSGAHRVLHRTASGSWEPMGDRLPFEPNAVWADASGAVVVAGPAGAIYRGEYGAGSEGNGTGGTTGSVPSEGGPLPTSPSPEGGTMGRRDGGSGSTGDSGNTSADSGTDPGEPDDGDGLDGGTGSDGGRPRPGSGGSGSSGESGSDDEDSYDPGPPPEGSRAPRRSSTTEGELDGSADGGKGTGAPACSMQHLGSAPTAGGWAPGAWFTLLALSFTRLGRRRRRPGISARE
jgi:hypothetical protein